MARNKSFLLHQWTLHCIYVSTELPNLKSNAASGILHASMHISEGVNNGMVCRDSSAVKLFKQTTWALVSVKSCGTHQIRIFAWSWPIAERTNDSARRESAKRKVWMPDVQCEAISYTGLIIHCAATSTRSFSRHDLDNYSWASASICSHVLRGPWQSEASFLESNR